MNRNNTLVVAKFFLLVLVVLVGANYVFAEWVLPGPGPTPDNNNTNAPINTSNLSQIKTGPLTILNNLWVKSGILTVDNKIRIGTESVGNEWDPNAVLDIMDGQIRIRGSNTDCPGNVCPTNGVLVSDANGLAHWSTQPPGGVTSLSTDPPTSGITFNSDTSIPTATSTSNGIISIYSPKTQKRIQNSCLGTNKGMVSVTEEGIANCIDFVTSVTAGSGLSNGGINTGDVTLTANVGNGLIIDTVGAQANKIRLNVDPALGDGLRFDGSKVAFEAGTSTGQTWQWSGPPDNKWNLASFPNPPTANALPGGSVMYLKRKSATTQNCPAALPSRWPTSGTNIESVGHATNFNYTTICYNTTNSVQVIQLKATSTAAVLPCPSGWSTLTGSNFGDTNCGNPLVNLSCNAEWAPGGTLTNYVRTCYL